MAAVILTSNRFRQLQENQRQQNKSRNAATATATIWKERIETEEERIEKDKERENIELSKTKENLQPPEYPIETTVNNSKIKLILYDNDGNFVFASSFDDATKKVQEDLERGENSILFKQLKREYYDDSLRIKKLRLSSSNKSFLRSAPQLISRDFYSSSG